jgi:L-rhamnose isomerase/sugar isomerase
MRDAYETDVRPVLAELREEIGRPADPLKSYRTDEVIRERRAWRQSNPARAAGGGLGA